MTTEAGAGGTGTDANHTSPSPPPGGTNAPPPLEPPGKDYVMVNGEAQAEGMGVAQPDPSTSTPATARACGEEDVGRWPATRGQNVDEGVGGVATRPFTPPEMEIAADLLSMQSDSKKRKYPGPFLAPSPHQYAPPPVEILGVAPGYNPSTRPGYNPSEDLELHEIRPPPSLCWGQLPSNHQLQCQVGFIAGTLHFKKKFCNACRECVIVEAERVRALTDAQRAIAVNKHSEGFWNRAPEELGGTHYRIVNNTATCKGPWLAIYRTAPPNLEWAPMPPGWVEDGKVNFCVAKGTLAPAVSVRGKAKTSDWVHKPPDANWYGNAPSGGAGGGAQPHGMPAGMAPQHGGGPPPGGIQAGFFPAPPPPAPLPTDLGGLSAAAAQCADEHGGAAGAAQPSYPGYHPCAPCTMVPPPTHGPPASQPLEMGAPPLGAHHGAPWPPPASSDSLTSLWPPGHPGHAREQQLQLQLQQLQHDHAGLQHAHQQLLQQFLHLQQHAQWLQQQLAPRSGDAEERYDAIAAPGPDGYIAEEI